MDLTKLSIKQTIEGLKTKKFTSLEVTNSYINNIEKNRNLNSFITETFDLAINQAKKSDENIQNGKMRELEGIPLGIKDLFCTKNIRTTCASKILENFIPPYESTVTQKLLDAGAIFLGKLNMDEFAMGSTNSSSYFGKAINPYKKKDSNEDLVPEDLLVVQLLLLQQIYAPAPLAQIPVDQFVNPLLLQILLVLNQPMAGAQDME